MSLRTMVGALPELQLAAVTIKARKNARIRKPPRLSGTLARLEVVPQARDAPHYGAPQARFTYGAPHARSKALAISSA
jgi:hypothetical protein